MKKLIAMGIIVGTIMGQDPITVSNVPGAAADFNDLQTALTASIAGSIIYVYGSSSTYGDINITKSVTLIGAGMFSDSPSLNRSKVGSVTFSLFQTDTSNGSSIIGFQATSEITVSTGLHDIRIERNIGKQINLTNNHNIYIINNFLDYSEASASSQNISMTECADVNIINNFIRLTGGTNSSGPASCVSGNNALVINNYMYAHNSYNSPEFGIISGSDIIIENNIFGEGGGQFSGVRNSQFRNNLYTSALPIGTNQNTGSSNIVGNAIFESSVFGELDFHMHGFSSLGIAVGTDGSDLGIQGGIYPFSNAYMPALPYVQQMNVPAIAPANGSINVEVIGKSHN